MAGGTTLEQEYQRLVSECARCQTCDHIQAEPDWCHRCGGRTTWPAWAEAWCHNRTENGTELADEKARR